MFEINAEADVGYVASGDLRLLQNRVVQRTGTVAFKVSHATANGGFGVLLNAPNNGENASVAESGVCMVRVGAAVNANDNLVSAISGWAITAGVTAGLQHVFGIALVGAASGMLCPVNLKEFYLPNSIA